MINNISNELKKCGIYKINYSNGKIYIGQALSIWKRAQEHNEKNKYPCDLALKKYDAIIEILEEVKDILTLDERETYWINFFDATNKENGQLESLKIALEATARGMKFINIDLYKSEANVWNAVNDTEILPPFSSIDGLGETVAQNIVEERKKNFDRLIG